MLMKSNEFKPLGLEKQEEKKARAHWTITVGIGGYILV